MIYGKKTNRFLDSLLSLGMTYCRFLAVLQQGKKGADLLNQEIYSKMISVK
jgi:hypothetical protein